MRYHLAQANAAYALASHDDPLMADFMARLDEINQLAEQSPGFVWRYATDSRDPGDRVYDDPRILFNMSVWESFEALHQYTYRTAHAELYAARKRWFGDWKTLVGGAPVALWWVPAGSLPSAQEGRDKLLQLREQGPSAAVFTMKQRYPHPGEP